MEGADGFIDPSAGLAAEQALEGLAFSNRRDHQLDQSF
jgi:hypothetical protein